MPNNSSTLNEQLIEAVIEGDLSAVQSLLRRKADKNAKTANGFTLLHYAADSGHLGIVKALLEKQAEIEAKATNDRTPLHIAARKGYLKVVETLLNAGADKEARDSWSYTPLHRVADTDQRDVVKLLLEKEAKIEAKDSLGRTPLHWAAIAGQRDVVEVLLEKKAEIEAKNNLGDTPLHLAAYKGHLEVVEILLKAGADKKAENKWGKTALDLAEEEGHNEVVALLQKVSVVDNVGHAASAITQNSQAEPLNSMQQISQVQPATKRSRNSEQASEETEVQPSAKKQKTSSIETTNTLLATAEALPASIYSYIYNDAELDDCLKNLSGEKQARYCCSLSRKIMFEPVWYQGKHYEREVWLAENPSFAAKGLIDFQLKNQILNCVQKKPELFKACYTPQYLCQQLEEALAQNELQTLEQLFKMEPLLIHAIDKQKNTWLHKAVKSQKLPLIKSLLAYQASLDKGNSERDRPLHLAVKTGNEEVVKLLLEAHQVQNIAINFPNKEKKKPLDLAEKDSAIANLLEQYQPVKTEFKWVKKLKLYYEKKDASRMVTKIKIPDHQHLKWMSMAELNQKDAENIVYGSLTFFYKIVNGDEKPIYDFISLKINWPNSFKPDANYLHVAYVYTKGQQELQLAADLGRMHPEHSDEINNIMKNIRKNIGENKKGKKKGFHNRFHHSERALFKVLETGEFISTIITEFSKKLSKHGDIKPKQVTIKSIILDAFSTRYPCQGNWCEEGFAYMQNPNSKFLQQLTRLLTEHHYQLPQRKNLLGLDGIHPLKPPYMISRISAAEPGNQNRNQQRPVKTYEEHEEGNFNLKELKKNNALWVLLRDNTEVLEEVLKANKQTFFISTNYHSGKGKGKLSTKGASQDPETIEQPSFCISDDESLSDVSTASQDLVYP